MLRRFLSFILVAWAISAQAQQTAALQLKGSIKGTHEGKVYLQKYIDRYYQIIDSTSIAQDGTFYFDKEVLLPEIYGLSVTPDDEPFLLFLEKGDISVELNAEHPNYLGSSVTGSVNHDLYREFHKNRRRDISAFIQEHPASLAALYILYREFIDILPAAELDNNLSLLDPALQKSSYADIVREVLKTREVIDVGQQAPSFTITDINGKTVSLNDFLGKGYLLIDFWASNCPRCRRENPNIVKTYLDFKDKGFDVLAISLDRTRDAWIKAIEKDGLPYHHVSDLKWWGSDLVRLYGVRFLPVNVLVDKDGKIVGKNLKQEDLPNTLRRLLGEL